MGIEMVQAGFNGKERRRFPRRTVDIDGVIMLPGNNRVICSIVNVSNIGAGLALDTLKELPSQFMLKIERPVPVYRFCKLSWQEGAMAGVGFSNRLAFLD